MNKILPKKLLIGDIVSVITPSSGLAPFAMHRIENAIRHLNSLGLKIKFEKHSLFNGGYVSAGAKERATDIHDAFLDKNVRMVICLIGGNHSNQILKYINWEIIKNNPKIFIGYSDITVLHHAIYKKTGLVTFYGPTIMQEFGERVLDKYTLNYFNKVLFEGKIGKVAPSKEWTDEFLDWFEKKDLERDRAYVKNDGFEWWKNGEESGDFFGGCIPSINHLAGTEYWNDLTDKILFIDLPEGHEPGEPLSFSDLDSYLADLDNLKIFEKIKGLVIGRPYGYKNYKQNVQKLKNIFMNYTEQYSYPILFGVDIGHTAPMITVPLGCNVKLSSEQNLFELSGEFIN